VGRKGDGGGDNEQDERRIADKENMIKIKRKLMNIAEEDELVVEMYT
jgi:hypothetical protein